MPNLLDKTPFKKKNGALGCDGSVFPIVGIGASIDGWEAVQSFLTQVPAESGMAYVIVQHREPLCSSLTSNLMTALLQRGICLPVAEITVGMQVEPDRIYVAPTDHNVSLVDGVLLLTQTAPPQGQPLPIDHFFESLANERQELGIGVIFSGTATDGLLGIQAIKDQGGLVAVQILETASGDDLLIHASDVGLADVIASSAQLPAQITFALQNSRRSHPNWAQLHKDEAGLNQILTLLHKHTGHDFSFYKKNTLYRRIERRMGLFRLQKMDDYINFLQQNAKESAALLKELLISVTRFFRDVEVWERLRAEVIPKLLSAHDDGDILRAWVPGCATGEEAYSLAMVFCEALEQLPLEKRIKLQIFATDLDQDAIVKARQGIYPAGIAADVSAQRLERFFVPEGNGYRISKAIRAMVIFAPHNVLADPPFGKIDLLTCRNLLIYLAPGVHDTLLRRFHYVMNPAAVLLLGSSESIGAATRFFAPLVGHLQLFQRLQVAAHINQVDMPFRAMPLPITVPILQNAKTMKSTTASNLQTLSNQFLLQRAPTAVLVNDAGDILHVSGKTDQYLELAEGKANWNILVMARGGLNAALNEAFQDALRLQEAVTLTSEQSASDGKKKNIEISVHPLAEPAALRGMMMVVFAELGTSQPAYAPDNTGQTTRQSDRLKTLEQAFQQTRETLQTTREEMQTSREELTSTNEELQSTNEELTTSTEELRTMNEELLLARSAAEQGLARYTDLFESAPVGYFTLDSNGLITRANIAGAELLSVECKSLVGGRFSLYVVESDRAAFMACLAQAFATRESHLCEVALWRDATEPCHVRVSAQTSEDRQSCRVVVADITERKEAEAVRRRLASIVESAADAILSKTLDGIVRSWNPAAERLFGYRADEMIGQNIGRLIPAERMHEESMLIGRISRGERVEHYESVRLHKDGTPIDVALTISPIKDASGRAIGASKIIHDISAGKRAEQALQESERRFRFLNDLSNAMRMLNDPREIMAAVTCLLGSHLGVSRCIYADMHADGERYAIHYDYTDGGASMVGKHHLALFGPHAVSELKQNRAWLLSDVAAEITADETAGLFDAFDIKALICCPLVKDGKLHAMMAVHQNTSRVWRDFEASLIEDVLERCWSVIERRKVQAALHRSEISLVAAQACAKLGNWELDLLTKKAFYSAEMYRLIGRDPKLGVPAYEEFMAAVHPDDVARCNRSFKQSIEGKSTKPEQFRYLYPEGAMRWLEGISEPVIDSDGKVLGLVGTIQDITDRKRDEVALKESEARYRRIVETAEEGIWTIDAEANTSFVNPRMALMLGYTAGEMQGRPLTEFMDDEGRSITAKNLALRKRGVGGQHDFRFVRKDGSDLWTSLTANPIHDASGAYAGALAMVTDITARRKSDELLQLAALVYQHSTEAMMVSDAQNRIIAINPAFTQTTGYTAEEVLGQDPRILSSGRHDAAFHQSVWQVLNSSGSWQGEIWNRRKNGEAFAEQLTINTIYHENGSVHRYVALFSDITQKKASEETIWHQANFDSLTQLPNRSMFHDRLAQDIKKDQRDGLKIGLLFIDLDRFKEVNDTLGHHKGDLLLIEAAQRIGSSVRACDTVARLGGDEFTVILTELDGTDNVERAAQKIIKSLAAPFYLGEDKAFVTASIGITMYPDDATEIEDLLKYADQAMYVAKSHGRNRYSYFTPALQQASEARMRLINDMRGALDDNQFRVYYQPIVELATGSIHKAEALLRWQHPVRGLISPAEFIPMAEHTGMIVEIGDWVFREAARQAKHWRMQHHPKFQISVNKSPVQFRNIGNNGKVTWPDYLQQLGLPGACIAVEITEGLLLDTEPMVLGNLLECRDAGIQVSLDDFGTGYSSLSYLKKFDIDYLKIDQSFVRNLETDANDKILCEAIIVMAHKLGLKVVAEGVETQEQRKLLIAAGCDYAQGYLFSHPVPAAQMILELNAFGLTPDAIASTGAVSQ